MTVEGKEEARRLPPLCIVKDHDILEKLWGWDRLVPMGGSVSWSAYTHYLEAYYDNTNSAAKSLSIAAIAETCCKKEEELMSEWKTCKESKMEITLPMSNLIILSCLIQQCANSVIHRANCKLSTFTVSNAALWCITNEALLMLELLRRGAHPCKDYVISQSREIRMCALSLMDYYVAHPLQNSDAVSAAMLGIAKEAKMMCEWMSENDMLLDLYDDFTPEVIIHSRIVQSRTLGVMFDMLNMLQDSAAASGGGGQANTAGGSISNVLNSFYQKTCGKQSNKRKRDRDDVLRGNRWERLILLYGSVEWSNYSNYLAEYYNENAYKFLVDAVSEQNLEDSGSSLPAALANHCLNMEEELVCKWMDRVPRHLYNASSISINIQSNLVKERVLAICGTEGEFSIFSAIIFMCVSMEADLMCELLKHGVKPSDHIIQQSSAIRMCALGLVNREGQESIASAAAMVGIARETKKMSDWMKRQNKLLTVTSEARELDYGRAIRNRTLDFMTSILMSSFQPEVSERQIRNL